MCMCYVHRKRPTETNICRLYRYSWHFNIYKLLTKFYGAFVPNDHDVLPVIDSVWAQVRYEARSQQHVTWKRRQEM